MGRWDTFKGWHGEPSFWREVYARTVAGVATAAVVFLAAVAGGYVKLHRSGAILIGSMIILFIGLYVSDSQLEKDQKAGMDFRQRQKRSMVRGLILFVAVGLFVLIVNLIAAD